MRELFGKKAVSTVAKRGNALFRFVSWVHLRFPGDRVLPFNSFHFDEYLEGLCAQKAKPGAFTSFTESVHFAIHVVGVPMDEGTVGSGFLRVAKAPRVFSPWALGLVATQIQKRSERKQSEVLTVDGVDLLEETLGNLTPAQLIGTLQDASCSHCSVAAGSAT